MPPSVRRSSTSRTSARARSSTPSPKHCACLLADGLRAAGFEVYQPQGTYFITTDITPFGEKDAHAFCRTLHERCGVVAIPNSVFYDDPDTGRTQVRFTFCKQDTVLADATTRLQRLDS